VMGLFSLLAAGLMGGSLIWALRRWPAAAITTGAVDDPNRRTPRRFLVEVSMFAVIAVGFTALLLYRIALADLPLYAQRTPAYLVSAAFLVVSTGSLMWAIHRHANQKRAAHLIPLLVIVAIGITVVTIQLII
jgi:heme/copper-type cytochrome/quinol oxidase subunit 3